MTVTNIPEDTWAKLSKDGFNTPIHAPPSKTGSEQTENKKEAIQRNTWRTLGGFTGGSMHRKAGYWRHNCCLMKQRSRLIGCPSTHPGATLVNLPLQLGGTTPFFLVFSHQFSKTFWFFWCQFQNHSNQDLKVLNYSITLNVPCQG